MNKVKKDNIKNEIKYIKKLIKEKKLNTAQSIEYYNEIYYKYGSEIYKKFVPKSVQKEDVFLLRCDNRYIDIYSKYGEKVFNCEKPIILENDVYYESGSKLKGLVYHCISELSYTFRKLFLPIFTGIVLSFPVGTAIASEKEKMDNYRTYTNEIENYIDNVKNYSKQIANYNLSDIENIMKVMNDTWNNTNGYGLPYKDLIGYLGLDIELGQGVCRNIADDFARKINCINPDYNAHIIVVNCSDTDSIVNLPPISRKQVPDFPLKLEQIHTDSLLATYPFKDLIGNHAVVLMNIPENNAQLIVDPTNPSVGVYSNGKITLFNPVLENDYSLSRNFMGDTLLSGFEGFEYPFEYIDSFNNDCKLSFEELDELYGIAAQNKALEKVKDLEVCWYGTSDKNNLTNDINDSTNIGYTYTTTNNIQNNINSKEKSKTNFNSFRESLIVSNDDLIKTNVRDCKSSEYTKVSDIER